MPEFLKLLDQQGLETGQTAEYSTVHQSGLWHQTVHIWIVLNETNILLQKRSTRKENYPGKFDVSCAGHVRHQESAWDAGKRELKEELGIIWTPQMRRVSLGNESNSVELLQGSYLDNEWAEIYILLLHELPEMHLPTDEVDDFRILSLDNFEQTRFTEIDSFVPHENEYRKLTKYLRNLNSF